MKSVTLLHHEMQSSKSQDVRLKACKEIGERKLVELIAPLSRLLNEDNLKIRTAAIEALVNFDHEDAVPAIWSVLEDPHPAIRTASHAFMESRTELVTPFLLEKLTKGGRLSRVSAARFLARFGEKKAVNPIIQQLGKCDRSSVIMMNHALSQLGELQLAALFPDIFIKKSESIEKAKDLLAAGDFRFVDPLVRYLEMCRHSHYHAEVHEVLNTLQPEAVQNGRQMYCMKHLRRFRLRRFFSNFFPVQFTPYVACRSCRSALDGEWVDAVVVVLNHEAPAFAWKDSGEEERIFVVNWFKQMQPFDFDRVEVHDATDQEITQFCVTLGNDTDRFRRKRYKKMMCIVADHCQLSQNSVRLLSRAFSTVHAATASPLLAAQGS